MYICAVYIYVYIMYIKWNQNTQHEIMKILRRYSMD